MTTLKKQDIIKILTLIRANYDNAYANTSPEEAELLINFWYECLKKYSYEIVYEATKRAITGSEFIPRLANIVAEAEKLCAPERKSDGELWSELTAVLGRVYEISRYLAYPQHIEWANGKIDEIYSSLDEDIKLYVVNKSALVEIAELSDEGLVYEKARFFKQMPILRQHSKDKAAAQAFLNAAKITPALSDGKDKK